MLTHHVVAAGFAVAYILTATPAGRDHPPGVSSPPSEPLIIKRTCAKCTVVSLLDDRQSQAVR